MATIKIKIDDRVQAVFGSRHKGHRGKVINIDGPYLTVRAEEPYPETVHTSALYGEHIFYVDRDKVKILKAT